MNTDRSFMSLIKNRWIDKDRETVPITYNQKRWTEVLCIKERERENKNICYARRERERVALWNKRTVERRGKRKRGWW